MKHTQSRVATLLIACVSAFVVCGCSSGGNEASTQPANAVASQQSRSSAPAAPVGIGSTVQPQGPITERGLSMPVTCIVTEAHLLVKSNYNGLPGEVEHLWRVKYPYHAALLDYACSEIQGRVYPNMAYARDAANRAIYDINGITSVSIPTAAYFDPNDPTKSAYSPGGQGHGGSAYMLDAAQGNPVGHTVTINSVTYNCNATVCVILTTY